MTPEQHQQADHPSAIDLPSCSNASIGIVVSEQHSEVSLKMLEGAVEVLKRYGLAEEDIFISYVPSAAELAFGARQMSIIKEPSAVIVLGCVLKQAAPQYDYLCQSVTMGVTELNLHSDIPYINGVLMTENMDQASQYAGGEFGNLGVASAESAFKMISMMALLVNS